MNNGQHNGQRSRMRGRNNNMNNNRRPGGINGGGNPLTKSYESNGPDVKIRGNAQTIAEKYISLARDAQVSGDYVMAENYHQHAEHYLRLISAAQGQFVNRSEEVQFDSEDDENIEIPSNNDIAAQDQPTVGDAFQNPRYRQNYNPQHNNGERHNNRERFNRNDRFSQDRATQADAQPIVQPSVEGEAFVPRSRHVRNEQTRNQYQRPRNPMEGIDESQPIAAPLAPKPIAERTNFVPGAEPELPAFLTATRRVAPRKPRPERPNAEALAVEE